MGQQDNADGGAMMRQNAGQHTLRFRLRVASRWLQATVQSGHRFLLDLLNEGQPFEAEQVVLQGDPYGYGRATPSPGWLYPERAIIAIPLDSDAPAPAVSPASASGAARELARLGVGPFEITGHVHLPVGATLHDLPSGTGSLFFAVGDAVVRRADGAGPVDRPSLVLVNRAHVDYLLPAPTLPLFDLTQGLLD